MAEVTVYRVPAARVLSSVGYGALNLDIDWCGIDALTHDCVGVVASQECE